MPQFFIHRPVFAWVIALFIVLLGVLAIPQLPISRYPTVAPPTRSEEHTSELQSRSDLVCRLLLEKKKKKYISARLKNFNPSDTETTEQIGNEESAERELRSRRRMRATPKSPSAGRTAEHTL